MKLNIKLKILFIFTGTLLVATALNLLFMSRVLEENYVEALESELFARADHLKSQLTRIANLGISVKDIEGFDRRCLDLVKKNKHLLDAIVIDSQGTILFHSDSMYRGKKIEPDQIIEALHQNQTRLIRYKKNGDDIYRAITIYQDDDKYSKYGILVSCPAAIIDAKVMSLISRCNTFFLSTFGFAALLLLVSLTQVLTKPLGIILHVIKDISSSKTLKRRVEFKTEDEIGQIASAFNRMIEDLNESTTSVERLNSEIETRKKAENKAQEAMLNAELANMSHEIRTPMNALIGFSEILYEESLTVDQRKYVKIILDNARELLYLINDILDFSKVEAGKLKVEKIECRLTQLLDGIYSTILPMASNKGIEFKLIKSPDLPDIIYTDPTRLRQCLINLLSNAVKFTHQGHVHLRVSVRSTDNLSKEICFIIEDTGIGIPKQKIESLFDAFSQADNSTTRKYGGTGLGLAITKQLVELLGGQISVTSKERAGSVFTICLPFETPVMSSVPLETPASA